LNNADKYPIEMRQEILGESDKEAQEADQQIGDEQVEGVAGFPSQLY
jgi:hypothetical protein